MNDNKTENCIEGEFFLPIFNKFKILIAGSGESIQVKSLYAKCIEIEIESNIIASSDKKNCECCKII